MPNKRRGTEFEAISAHGFIVDMPISMSLMSPKVYCAYARNSNIWSPFYNTFTFYATFTLLFNMISVHVNIIIPQLAAYVSGGFSLCLDMKSVLKVRTCTYV